MRKLILVILIATMLTTPCFAQEIEPEGLFSIDGTLWAMCGFSISPYYGFNVVWPFEVLMGFDEGRVYRWDKKDGEYVYPDHYCYINTPFVSIVFSDDEPRGTRTPIAILQPIGFGTFSSLHLAITIAIMFKVNDNWKPEVPIFDSIFPSQGEQGSLLTDVTITSKRTTFEEDGVGAIKFDLRDGDLTASNIKVINNTEIAFDLLIADDALTLVYDIFVDDDSGKRIISVGNAFEVLEKLTKQRIDK